MEVDKFKNQKQNSLGKKFTEFSIYVDIKKRKKRNKRMIKEKFNFKR